MARVKGAAHLLPPLARVLAQRSEGPLVGPFPPTRSMAIAWSVWASSAASSAKSLAVTSEVTWTASTSSSSVADALR